MLPILKFMGDKKEHSLKEIMDHIYATSNLTEAEKRQLLPSGREPIFGNRIRWARFYLEKAGLLESPRRARSVITERGLKVLGENPSEINVKYLRRFPDFVDYMAQKKKREKKKGVQKTITSSLDPMELLENAHHRLMSEIAEELLKQIKKSSSTFFENLIVDLLVKMGYGGSRLDAGEAVGQSGDEGIDGIIKEDKLGLDTVYLQAKKWEGTVGRPEIHKFVGALKGQGANKGIFITTSRFSKEAENYASRIDSPKVVLINGTKLAELMIEHDVGVLKVASYNVKKIDLDLFSGD